MQTSVNWHKKKKKVQNTAMCLAQSAPSTLFFLLDKPSARPACENVFSPTYHQNAAQWT